MTIRHYVKRILGLSLAALTILGAAACSQPPKQDITQVAEKLQEAESFHYDMTMAMEMTIAGQPLSIATVASADQTMHPLAMKLNITTDMGEIGNSEKKMYMEETDGTFYVYTAVDQGDSVVWQRTEMKKEEVLKQYDAQGELELYLSSAERFTEAGKDTVNGIQTTRYHGVIVGEDIAAVLEASGTLDGLGSLGVNEDIIASMWDTIGDLPVSIWVSDDNYPVQYRMDMTEIMQALTAGMTDQLGISFGIGQTEISMTFSKFNEIEPIVMPESVPNS